MRKKMDLNAFDLFQYLKERYQQHYNAPFFLANQDTYKSASISFPIRNFSYGIGVTYAGNDRPFKVGSEEYPMATGSLITIGPGIVSHWTSGNDCIHDTVYFTEELFKNTLKNSVLKVLPFFLHGGNHVIVLDNREVAKFKALFETLKLFKDDVGAVEGLTYSIIKFAEQCHKIRAKSGQNNFSVKQKLVTDFKSELSKHFPGKKEVAFYAKQLHVSPKYLSEVLLLETGKTAKAIIEDYVFFEAKSLLRQTSMSVQEICYLLGYADASYFTKAFKKNEGITPLEYRNL